MQQKKCQSHKCRRLIKIKMNVIDEKQRFKMI